MDILPKIQQQHQVYITLKNLYKDVEYVINAYITNEGEIYNSDTNKRIFPLEKKDTNQPITHERSSYSSAYVVENLVKAVELLRKDHTYTKSIGTILGIEDPTTDDVIGLLLHTMTTQDKFKDSKAFEQLVDLMNKIPNS